MVITSTFNILEHYFNAIAQNTLYIGNTILHSFPACLFQEKLVETL